MCVQSHIPGIHMTEFEFLTSTYMPSIWHVQVYRYIQGKIISTWSWYSKEQVLFLGDKVCPIEGDIIQIPLIIVPLGVYWAAGCVYDMCRVSPRYREWCLPRDVYWAAGCVYDVHCLATGNVSCRLCIRHVPCLATGNGASLVVCTEEKDLCPECDLQW